jgi:hypothetical protein
MVFGLLKISISSQSKPWQINMQRETCALIMQTIIFQKVLVANIFHLTLPTQTAGHFLLEE